MRYCISILNYGFLPTWNFCSVLILCKYLKFWCLMWIKPGKEQSKWNAVTIFMLMRDQYVIGTVLNTTHNKVFPFLQQSYAHMLSHFNRVRLCATIWTVAHQAPLSTGFSRQEYWSGLLFPSPHSNPISNPIIRGTWKLNMVPGSIQPANKQAGIHIQVILLQRWCSSYFYYTSRLNWVWRCYA